MALDDRLRVQCASPDEPPSPAPLTLCAAGPPEGWASMGLWVHAPADGPLPQRAQLEQAVEAARRQARQRRGLLSPEQTLDALRRIVDLASESIEITDSSVRLVHANPAFEAITGWAIEEAAGHSTAEFFRAGTHEPSYYAGIMATLRRGEVWRGPLIGRRRDGELSLQEATLAAIPSPDGGPAGFIAIKRDTARDALASAALQSRERRFESLINSAGDGVYVHDDDGRVLDANLEGYAMLGREPEARPLGLTLAERFTPNGPSSLRELLAQVRVGAPVTIEGAIHGAGASTVPVSLRVGAFLFGGERFLLTLARDVRDRVALEERLRERGEALSRALEEQRALQAEVVRREKMAALGELVAGVAHEVNTPLGVTVTAVSHARASLDELRAEMHAATPSRRKALQLVTTLGEALELAIQNADRAARLIADFKRVSVDQSSDLERVIELSAYAATVCGSLSPMRREGQVELSLEVGHAPLLTRPGAIAQILANLIQNAVLHAFPGPDFERKIWVRGGRTGEEAWTEVEDHGVGIAPELGERVLLPFVSTRMGSGGSGLGLTVVHNLTVELLRGQLRLSASPNGGTTVSLRFPARCPKPLGH